MVETGQVIVKTGKGLWPLFKTILKIGILTVVFFFVIFNSVKESFQEGTIKPLVTEVGGRFFLITYNLYNDTNQIIQNYVQAGFLDKLEFLSQLFFDVYVIWLWMRLLKTIAQWAITQDDSKVTANWMIGIILFFLLQYIFILAALLFNYIPNLDEASVFSIPLKAFSNFFRAMPELIEPFINFASKMGF